MFTVKEEFLNHPKTRRAIKLAGWETVGMWMAMKTYCAQVLTDGFVPDDEIDALPGAPKNPRKALAALVECGCTKEDGTRGSGLVDPVDRGWKLHDYLDHANSADEEQERRRRERERKAAWRKAKVVSRCPGDGDGTVTGHVPGTEMGQ